jgi:threonine 3-dehydrogenase
MLALVKAQSAAGLSLLQVEDPRPGEDEVLIRVRKTGICGTDLHIWNWDDWASRHVPVPLVIGHEYMGEIVEVGSRVKGFQIGDRVTGEGHLINIDSCAARAGRFHLDPHSRSVGIDRPGAFAELLALPAFNVIRLPDAIDDELGAILDPLGNAVHTALAFDLAGNDVMVMGAGLIGVMAAAVARHAGAGRVFIGDIQQSRLDLACRVADVVPINVSQQTPREAARSLGLKHGFPLGFEMSGSATGLEQLIQAMANGGRVACLGLPSTNVTLDWAAVVLKSLHIRGIYGREMFETWRRTLSLIGSGLNVRKIITHCLPAERFAEGFAAMQSGEAGKVVLSWDHLRTSGRV